MGLHDLFQVLVELPGGSRVNVGPTHTSLHNAIEWIIDIDRGEDRFFPGLDVYCRDYMNERLYRLAAGTWEAVR